MRFQCGAGVVVKVCLAVEKLWKIGVATGFVFVAPLLFCVDNHTYGVVRNGVSVCCRSGNVDAVTHHNFGAVRTADSVEILADSRYLQSLPFGVAKQLQKVSQSITVVRLNVNNKNEIFTLLLFVPKGPVP